MATQSCNAEMHHRVAHKRPDWPAGCGERRHCQRNACIPACHSPRIGLARPCYGCRQPACVPKYTREVLKISGTAAQTAVKNCEQDTWSVLYTYNVALENRTGHTIGELHLDADIRVLECGAERPLIGKGECSCYFNTKDIDVLVQNKSRRCKCNRSECCCGFGKDCVELDADCIHVKLHDLVPGTTIVTFVVPLFNECPEEQFPCKMLPALFTARVLQCICNEPRVVYQNSILLGDQPRHVQCDDESESDSESEDCSESCDHSDDCNSIEDCSKSSKQKKRKDHCGASTESSEDEHYCSRGERLAKENGWPEWLAKTLTD